MNNPRGKKIKVVVEVPIELLEAAGILAKKMRFDRIHEAIAFLTQIYQPGDDWTDPLSEYPPDHREDTLTCGCSKCREIWLNK